MSTFIVDPAHIDVMLSVAVNGPKGIRPGRWTGPYVFELLDGDEHTGPVTRDTADLAGRALLSECIASVSYYYDAPLGELPGPLPNPDPEQYEWTDFGKILTPIEGCYAIVGFECESCQHPGWWDSGAHHFCQRFQAALIRCIHGYDDAKWHWTPEKALARAPRAGNWRTLG